MRITLSGAIASPDVPRPTDEQVAAAAEREAKAARFRSGEGARAGGCTRPAARRSDGASIGRGDMRIARHRVARNLACASAGRSRMIAGSWGHRYLGPNGTRRTGSAERIGLRVRRP